MHSKLLRILNQFIYMRLCQPYFHKMHNQTACSSRTPPLPPVPHTQIIIYGKWMTKFCILFSRFLISILHVHVQPQYSHSHALTDEIRYVFTLHLQFTYFTFSKLKILVIYKNPTYALCAVRSPSFPFYFRKCKRLNDATHTFNKDDVRRPTINF